MSILSRILTPYKRFTADSKQVLRGFCWLLLLAPFFFLTYIPVNQYTATRTDVGVWVFSWEHLIPFWSWTIIPYWSEDLFYGLSLFICVSKREQTVHALRLIAASIVACTGFLLFPLRFSFGRPQTDGIFGWFFEQLSVFDLPYNQAPSLHIILLWLLWLRFKAHTPKKWLWLLHSWFLLIGISVLTTWQHHFIDVLTGFVAAIFISYLFPVETAWQWQKRTDPKATQLSRRYLLSGSVILVLAYLVKGWLSWGLLWIGVDLILVALAYAGFGVSIFQKNQTGNLSLSAKIILAPFLTGAWTVVCWFNRKIDDYNEIIPDLFLGKYPQGNLPADAVLDVTGEWFYRPYPKTIAYYNCPRLDLVIPTIHELQQSVETLSIIKQKHQKILVHCALGLSRSAIVVVAWLVERQYAQTIEEAIKIVKQARPAVFLREEHIAVLQAWQDHYEVFKHHDRQ